MFRSSLLRVWLPISLAVHITLLTVSQLMHVFTALPLVPKDDTIQIVQLPVEETPPPPPPPPENIPPPPPPPDDVKVTDVTKPVAVDVKAPPAAAEVKPTYRTADSAKVPAESLPPPPIPGNSQSPMLPLPFTPGNSFSTLPDGPATPMLPQPGQVTTAPRMAMGIPGRVSLTPAQLGDGPAARGQVASNQISAATPSAGSLGGAPVMVANTGGAGAPPVILAGMPGGGGNVPGFPAPDGVLVATAPVVGAPVFGNLTGRVHNGPPSNIPLDTPATSAGSAYSASTGVNISTPVNSTVTFPVAAGIPNLNPGTGTIIASANIPSTSGPGRTEVYAGIPMTSPNGVLGRYNPPASRPSFGAKVVQSDYLPPTSIGLKEKLKGTVKLSFAVTVDGTCDNVEITERCPFDSLNNHSIYLMEKKIRFNPAVKDGVEIRSENLHCQIVYSETSNPVLEMLP